MSEGVKVRVIKPLKGEIFDVELEYDVLQKNEQIARENRILLQKHGIISVDIMGGVGVGKTSLIEKSSKFLKKKNKKIGFIAGDLQTTIDADRISRYVSQTVQINTGKECHLDANLVKKALKNLKLKELDILFIENVGNIICPVEFPLGTNKRIVVISVTDGPYVIKKHPHVFKDVSACVINKIDLLEAIKVDIMNVKKDLLGMAPEIKVFETNCLTGKGIKNFIDFIYA